MHARELLFEFSTVDGGPKTIDFNLDGLYVALKPIAETCGVDY